MSSGNVEIVKAGFEAFNEGGVEDLLWQLRDGKAIGLELYPTLDETLEAAGDG